MKRNTLVLPLCVSITDVITLGDIIKEQREARKWSQDDLAKRAGLAQTTIGNIEAGIRGAKGRMPASLPAIAGALGMSTDELLSMAGIGRRPLRPPETGVLQLSPRPREWPFPGIDEDKVRSLSKRDRKTLAGRLLVEAAELGLDIQKERAA